jgi:PKD repeat protein/photosystem II stability/assembly factor-like uncharacterized protein
MKKLPLVCALTLVLSFAFAQHEKPYGTNANTPLWVQLMYSGTANEGEIVQAYESHYKTHPFVKNKHTQYYKRWLRNIARETLPQYNTKTFKENQQHYLELTQTLQDLKGPSSQWQCIGPFDFDLKAESQSYAAGAAHVYTVEQSISNPNVLYAGTATAGVWKTIDKGQNWTQLTNDMLFTSVFSIEIDHTDENTVYFEGGGSVYKTTDGGTTWNLLNDVILTSVIHDVMDLVMHPTNNQILFLASDQGFYRSLDAGASWTQQLSGAFQELEFHPTNPDIIYCVEQSGNRTYLHRSDDGGNNFALKINGWPAPISTDEQNRTEIAVSLAAPDNVYALATGEANGGSGLYGIYVSTDTAETWTFQCCGPQPGGPASLTNQNLMAWAKDGTDDGGQYYYDLALEVSETDPNKIHVAGVNHWISTDMGATFTCPSAWYDSDFDEYVHADIHDIRYFGNDLWFACDGGIFYSSNGGDTITPMMNGIAGTDFWGYGAGFQNGDVMLGGTYHNGTLLKDGNTYINGWISTGGGDNVLGHVNFGDDRKAVHDYGGKILSGDRTQPITNFQFDSLPSVTYITGASSEIVNDPRCYNIAYIGNGTGLYKTTDFGTTFQLVHSFGGQVAAIEVAWSDPDVMYISTYPGWWSTKEIWRTNDGGITWTDITPTNAQITNEDWVPYDLAVSSTDANTVWMARTSQYNGYPDMDGYNVFKSSNGGTTWNTYSTPTLDGESIVNIVHHRGTNGGVYIGTRRAVYYRNSSLTDWQLFNNNLPAVTHSTKLVPYYKGGKLRNGTNRSAYEVDFYETAPPSAQIAADRFTADCLNESIQFIDHSALSNDNPMWQWTFQGGTPNSSTQQNPVVTYSTPGFYDVSLTVTDDYGTSTQDYVAFIEYTANTTASLQEDFETSFVPAGWRLFNAAGTYNWQSFNATNGVNCTPTTVAFVDHYSIDQVGDEAELITSKVDMNGMAIPMLTYDYAYAQYGSGYEDGFRIEISNDCGTSWTMIYEEFGDSLQTVPPQGNWWEPACGDWQSMAFDLSAWSNDTIMVRFVAINDFGNNFFLDNINIDDVTEIEEKPLEQNVQLYPNPTSGAFFLATMESVDVEIYSSEGRLIKTVNNLPAGQTQLNFEGTSGLYYIRIFSEDEVVLKKLIRM